MVGVTAMENQELFSALRRVFNVTEFNRGKLGEAVKAHEKDGRGNWFFVQTSKGITSAIIPFEELESLVRAKGFLEQLINAILYQEAVERVGTSKESTRLEDAMKKLGLNAKEIADLAGSVEFE